MKKHIYVIIWQNLCSKASTLTHFQAQILAHMAIVKGILRSDRFLASGTLEFPHTELIYTFPISKVGKDDVFLMSFYLTKNDKCYKYIIEYSSNFIDDVI